MSLPTRDAIVDRLRTTLEPMVADPEHPVAEPAAELRPHLDLLVSKGEYTVRDGILTLLAMEVEHGEVIDWAMEGLHNPARGASKVLGSTLYPELHIAGSREALQTGVKGTSTYLDRSNQTWKAVLTWAAEQDNLAAIEAAFLYLASAIAATARNLPDFPELDTPKLTFASVFSVLDGMLGTPSGGAHEQMIFAALLEAYHAQIGGAGLIETKHINAADAAAGTAADVQEKHGGQVVEAYELTADTFDSKVRQAAEILRRHDLRRVHIVAKGASRADAGMIAQEVPAGEDLTVLDVREEARSILARLNKGHRQMALERLYWLLVDKQPNDALVSSFVSSLRGGGLTEES